MRQHIFSSLRIMYHHLLVTIEQELTKLFGTEWAVENLLPPIVQIREHESYLRRLTALKACSMMATAMDADSARLHLLPIIVDMAADVVRWDFFSETIGTLHFFRINNIFHSSFLAGSKYSI